MFCKHEYTERIKVGLCEWNLKCKKCGHQIWDKEADDIFIKTLFDIKPVILDGTLTYQFSLKNNHANTKE